MFLLRMGQNDYSVMRVTINVIKNNQFNIILLYYKSAMFIIFQLLLTKIINTTKYDKWYNFLKLANALAVHTTHKI